MTLQLGGGGAITGCTSLQEPALTLSGLTVSGPFDVEKIIVSSGTAAAPTYTFSGDTDNGLYYAGTNSIGLATNGTNAILIGSTGRVGIGTSAPYNVLTGKSLSIGDGTASAEVNFLSSSTGFGALYFGDAASGLASYTGYLEYDHSSNYMRFATNGSERMRIDSSGNVGIGTTSPVEKLDVRGKLYLNNGSATYIDAASSNGLVVTNPTAVRFEVGTERMRIDSSGNVFIGGTTAASADIALNANGSATFAKYVDSGPTTGEGLMRIRQDSDTNAFAIYKTSGYDYKVVMKGDGSATFAGDVTAGGNANGGSADGVRLQTLGLVQASRVGANQSVWNGYKTGTNTITSNITAAGSATFAGAVVVNNSSNSRAFIDGNGIYQTNTSGNNVISLLNDGSGTFAGAIQIVTTNSALRSFATYLSGVTTSSIEASGTATFAGTVSAQGSVLTSDQRFKENITDANAQLADVTALGNSLRNWDWTADAPVADKDTRFLGLVAQEAETICPGIVTTIARTKDGAELTPEVVVPAVYETKTVPAVLDDEGEVVEVLVTEEQVTPATYEQLDDSYKGIKNDILIMKLLGAVAELSAEVAALKAG